MHLGAYRISADSAASFCSIEHTVVRRRNYLSSGLGYRNFLRGFVQIPCKMAGKQIRTPQQSPRLADENEKTQLISQTRNAAAGPVRLRCQFVTVTKSRHVVAYLIKSSDDFIALARLTAYKCRFTHVAIAAVKFLSASEYRTSLHKI